MCRTLMDLRYWGDQTSALSRSFRVKAYSRWYNYPYQNESKPDHSAIIEADGLLVFMDEPGWENASVLGHS